MEEFQELAREPWWQVIAVFGDDDHFDFAYTVGLSSRDLPELHLWSQPSLGEDPGADWRFSSRDMMQLLNRMAWRFVDGHLAVGSEWEEVFDAGQVMVRFVVGPPTDAEELQAYQAGDDPVLPVRWSLHREPDGPPTPLSAEQAAVAVEDYDTAAGALATHGAVSLPRWEVPDTPSWSPTQRWGPRTPLVLAHAQSLLQSSPRQMVDMLNLAFPLSERHMTDYAVVVARAAARPVGRSAAIDRLLADTTDLVEDLGRTWGHEAWQATFAWINEDEDEEEALEEATVKVLLGRVIRPYLVTVAAQDLLPIQVVVHGAGPFTSAMCGRGVPPSAAWHAAPHVIEATSALVLAAGAGRLVEAATAWVEPGGDDSAVAHGDVAVLAATTPAMFPPWQTVLPSRFARDVRQAARGRIGPEDVQDWLSAVTTTLSHRTRLDPATVAFVTACGEVSLPGLRRLLDEPLTVG